MVAVAVVVGVGVAVVVGVVVGVVVAVGGGVGVAVVVGVGVAVVVGVVVAVVVGVVVAVVVAVGVVMPTRVIRKPEHVDALAEILRGRKMPITVSWAQGAPLSDRQRNLSFRWYTDISRQLGDRTMQEARAECKLFYGIPILREAHAAFKQSYDTMLKPHTTEAKLKFIEDTEFPVTSLMTTRQMSEYLDKVHRVYSQQGVHLTDPDAAKWEMEFER